jgi:hypothetical protein
MRWRDLKELDLKKNCWIHFSVFLKKIKIEKEILYSSLIFNRIDFIQRKTSLSTGADADAVHSVHHPSPVLPNEKRIVFFLLSPFYSSSSGIVKLSNSSSSWW